MPPRARKQWPPELTCVHCKVRKKIQHWDYCTGCRLVLIKDGVIKPRKKVPFAVRFQQYCDLFNKGFTQAQIAERLGLDKSYISSIPAKAKELGLQPPTRSHGATRITEHGGGTAGIRGCDCVPCVKKRKDYKKDWSAGKKQKIKQGIYAKPTKVTHGTGSRGIEGCGCELCVQRRKDYKRDWDQKTSRGRRPMGRKASVAQPG